MSGDPVPAPAAGPAAANVTGDDGWRRLHWRMIFLHVRVLGPLLALAVGSFLVGGGHLTERGKWSAGPALAAAVLVVVVGLIRYATTRYRITPDRVERRSGLVTKQRMSIPRDRIRSVDVTANPVHRILGLAVVKVGTGQHVGSGDQKGELALDAVLAAEADRLRVELLQRPAPSATPADGTTASAAAPAAPAPAVTSTRLAGIDWAWLRYAPLTVWTFLGVVIVASALYRMLDAIGVDNPLRFGPVRDAYGAFSSAPLWLAIVVVLAGIVVLGVVGSLVLYVEGWWRFRLERESNGMLRVRRGLLTTRSVSLEERRLRGTEIAEPLLLRFGGGARVKAVATGLGSDKDRRNRDTLLPPAPRAEALRVAAAVLHEDRSPTDEATLASHPPVALRRRRVRAVVAAVVLAAIPALLGVLVFPPLLRVALVVLVVVAIAGQWFARDAYRSLGHGLTGRYLVTRSGTFSRRTVALRREGIIGWTVARSPFQRRVGLCSLWATTAAGPGAYAVRDVTDAEAVTFADRAVPDLLVPFLAGPAGADSAASGASDLMPAAPTVGG